MTVSELREYLEKFPGSYEVHLDVIAGGDGDRIVRPLIGVRYQHGYYAVALDAALYNAGWKPKEIEEKDGRRS